MPGGEAQAQVDASGVIRRGVKRKEEERREERLAGRWLCLVRKQTKKATRHDVCVCLVVSGPFVVLERCSRPTQPQGDVARKCRGPTRQGAGRATTDEQREQADCSASKTGPGQVRRGEAR